MHHVLTIATYVTLSTMAVLISYAIVCDIGRILRERREETEAEEAKE